MRTLITTEGVESEPDAAQLQACLEQAPKVGFWLDIQGPEEEDFELLRDVFKFHPLTLEDIREPNQRPKLDEYPGYNFAVLYAAEWRDGRIEFLEHHLYHSKHAVVTVHYQPAPTLDDLRRRIREGPELTLGSPSFLSYLVLDALVDEMFPVLDQLDEAIDDLQDEVVDRASESSLGRIQSLKHQVTELRRQLAAQRDVFQRLVTHSLSFHDAEISVYYRDVYDHIVRQYETVDSLRDLLSGATDVYLSTVSTRLGATTKQLTVVASVFLPLSFLTGFFGMNFAFLVNHITAWWTFVGGVAIMLSSIVVQLYLFRRRGWI